MIYRILIIIFSLFLLVYVMDFDLFKERYEHDETRRLETLKQKLVATRMMYKSTKIVNEEEKIVYENLGEKLIPLLDTDIRFLPYCEFIVAQYEYRNEKFPKSKDACFQFFDHNISTYVEILENAKDDELSFKQYDASRYEIDRPKYIIKNKGEFNKIDYYFLSFMVNHQEALRNSCGSHENYNRNEMKNIYKIYF